MEKKNIWKNNLKKPSSNWLKNNIYIQEAQINSMWYKFWVTNIHIIGKKCSKTKSWKQQQQNNITYKRTLVRLTDDFSAETMESRRQWDDIFKVLRGGKNCQPRVLYLANLSFKNESEYKIVPNKQKLKEFLLANLLYKKFFRLKLSDHKW